MARSLISKTCFFMLILGMVFAPISSVRAQDGGPALPTPTSTTSAGGAVYAFPTRSDAPTRQPDPNDPNLVASGVGQPPSVSAAAVTYDDRENTNPVSWYVYEHQTISDVVATATTNNLRVVDWFVEDPISPYQLTTVYVANSGTYAKTWWLLANINPTDLLNFVVSNNARIIIQKAFNDPAPGGTVRFFAVLIPNTGADSKSWFFYQGKTISEITSLWQANNARLVQVNSYVKNAVTLYDVVMISNTGNDARTWWWYANATPADIITHLNANNARLVDMDIDPTTGNYNVIMNSCQADCPAWGWYYGLPTSSLLNTVLQDGDRIIDANSTAGCGDRCWSIILIDNTHVTISGNAGVSGATLSYTDGAPKITSADVNGNYSIKVPINWSGNVTPSKPGTPSFRPAHRTYANVTNHQTGQAYQPNLLSVYTSNAAQDGYIRESTETSGVGQTINHTAATFLLGDDALNRQYRALLSFNTSGLPNTAVILSAKLKLKKQGGAGANPFSLLGLLAVDIRMPKFGAFPALQVDDFNAPAGLNKAGVVGATPVGGVYVSNLAGVALAQINKNGLTQLRLRFQLDDNNNHIANYLSFYSSEASTAAFRPVLEIVYYVP